MNTLNYLRNFDFEKFIWDRYDPYGYNSISIEKVYKDIFLAIVGFATITLWFYGIITFCKMILNPEMFISGMSFIIVISALICTFILLVAGIMYLAFEAADGNIETWNRIMEYKLLKR